MARCIFLLTTAACVSITAAASPMGDKMNGFVYAAYGTGSAKGYASPLADASFHRMLRMGVTHVELVLTWYIADLTSTTIAPSASSPTFADLTHVASLCAAANVSVVIKPHVDVATGESRCLIGSQYNADDLTFFFSNYTSYMLAVAAWANAQPNGVVHAFNVGTELRDVSYHTAEWRAVIAAVRSVFSGPLMYGALYDREPYSISFWDDLDFIGIDAYYTVASAAHPNQSDIAAHWATISANLSALSSTWGKSIVFTEIGYFSFAAAGVQPGGLQPGALPDVVAQANLWTGFFNDAYTQPWLQGVFPWDWTPSPYDGGVCDTGLSIQHKPAETLFTAQYGGAPQKSERRAGSTAAVPLILYQNGVADWVDASWDASVSLTNASVPFPGHAASISARIQAMGALSLEARAPLNVSAYTALSFDVRVDAADDTTAAQLRVFICTCKGCTGCELRARTVAAYTNNTTACVLPDAWGRAGHVEIPFMDLGVTDGAYANSTVVQRVVLQYANATGVTDVYVDNVMLL